MQKWFAARDGWWSAKIFSEKFLYSFCPQNSKYSQYVHNIHKNKDRRETIKLHQEIFSGLNIKSIHIRFAGRQTDISPKRAHKHLKVLKLPPAVLNEILGLTTLWYQVTHVTEKRLLVLEIFKCSGNIFAFILWNDMDKHSRKNYQSAFICKCCWIKKSWKKKL